MRPEPTEAQAGSGARTGSGRERRRVRVVAGAGAVRWPAEGSRRSTSTFQPWLKPRSANATRSICTGMISSVTTPISPALRSGCAKPASLRSNQLGRGDEREDHEQHAERGGERQHAAAPADRGEDHQDVDDDEAELDQARPLQHLPAADRVDQQQRDRHEQQQNHDHARALHDRLVAVGVRDDDAARAAIRFLPFPNRRSHRGKPYNLRRSPCAPPAREARRGRGGIGRHAGLRSQWAHSPWGFESLRPHRRGAARGSCIANKFCCRSRDTLRAPCDLPRSAELAGSRRPPVAG